MEYMIFRRSWPYILLGLLIGGALNWVHPKLEPMWEGWSGERTVALLQPGVITILKPAAGQDVEELEITPMVNAEGTIISVHVMVDNDVVERRGVKGTAQLERNIRVSSNGWLSFPKDRWEVSYRYIVKGIVNFQLKSATQKCVLTIWMPDEAGNVLLEYYVDSQTPKRVVSYANKLWIGPLVNDGITLQVSGGVRTLTLKKGLAHRGHDSY